MSASTLTPTSRLLAFLAIPFVAIKAAMERRQIVGHLAGFDDHMLRDIGLTRGDIDSVMADSALDDPTLRLYHLARDARAARREIAREELRWARLMDAAEPHPEAELGRRAA